MQKHTEQPVSQSQMTRRMRCKCSDSSGSISPAMELPGYRFSSDVAQSPSFVTIWPAEIDADAVDLSYLASKFTTVLEGNVAAGDWLAWVLALSRQHLAEQLLHCQPCHECKSVDVPMGHTACPLHGLVAEPSPLCWVLVWQTRSPSTAVVQRAELRRLWTRLRWCLPGAQDYSFIFKASVLETAHDKLQAFNALVASRLGFRPHEPAPPAPEPTSHLQILDLPVAKRYKELAKAFAAFAEASAEVLEAAATLFAAIDDGAWLDALRAIDEPNILGNGCACWHRLSCAQGSCACQRPAVFGCQSCEQLFCRDCANLQDDAEQLTLMGPDVEAPQQQRTPFWCVLCCRSAACFEQLLQDEASVLLCAPCFRQLHNKLTFARLLHETIVLAKEPAPPPPAGFEYVAEELPLVPLQPQQQQNFTIVAKLLPGAIEALLLRSRRILQAGDRDWLRALLFEEIKRAELVPVRLKRLHTMDCPRWTAGHSSSDLPQTEFVHLVYDVLTCLQLMGATSCKPAWVPDILAPVITALLPACELQGAWLPRSIAYVHKQRMDRYKKPILKPLSKLFAAWLSAPCRAESQLSFEDVPPPPRKCLNIACTNPIFNESKFSLLSGEGEAELKLSRCPRCRFPLSFGRTVCSLSDLLPPEGREKPMAEEP